MKANRWVGVRVFCAMLLCVSLAHAQDPPPPAAPAPSLWQRIKNGAAQGARQGAGTPNSGQRQLSDGLVDTQYKGPIFEAIQPKSGGRFSGLFAHDDHTQAQLGRLQWPRAAITFVEYGGQLTCWTARARIWTDARNHHDETFRVCESPISGTDDLGQPVHLNEMSARYLNSRLQGVRTMTLPHTGTQHTEGPNPPLQPWDIKISAPLGHDNPIAVELYKILPRLAWVAGYATAADVFQGNATIATGFQDPRMWFAGFDPAGNRDAAP